jgi:hypothetical protein
MTLVGVTWFIGVALVAVTIAPILKIVGLLPHDLLVSWGMPFPGLEQAFFGPLMAFFFCCAFSKPGRRLFPR